MGRSNTKRLKQEAAEQAVDFVESGMVVGLGHGSTAIFAVRRIAQLLRSGELKDIHGVPCSIHVEKEARELDIPMITLNNCLTASLPIDLTIDGADEVDPDLNLIKGGGGALLREKIVAQASRREIIVIDESKLSPALGTHWAVPVEVICFGCRSQYAYLESLGARITIRGSDGCSHTSVFAQDFSKSLNGTPFRTDQGNQLLDCNFGPISDPYQLAEKLNERAGIVEHGLFLDLATDVIVAGDQGVERLTR